MAVSQPWKTKAWNELVRRRSSVANMSCVLSGSGVTFHDFMYYKSCSLMLKTPGVFSFFSIISFEIKLESPVEPKCHSPFSGQPSLLSARMNFYPLPLHLGEGLSPESPLGLLGQVQKAVGLDRVDATKRAASALSFA